MIYLVHDLRWDELAPAKRTVDLEQLRPELERLVRAEAASGGPDRDRLARAIDRTILVSCGAWAAGWAWATSEPGGGGPVHHWCCSTHSLLAELDNEPGESTSRVLAALDDWSTFLRTLDARFAELRAQTEHMELRAAVEYAAARLVVDILERTHAEDAWYATFTRTLVWYLESAAYDGELIGAAIAELVRGRFESWMAPDDACRAEVCAELGRRVEELETKGPPLPTPDALAAWRKIRERPVDPPFAGDRVAVADDGHERYIERFDRPRDPARADRLAAALTLCRDSARLGMRITLDQLSEWQAIVLGERVEFRTGAAYAKRGREWYSYGPDTQAQFERALDQAADRREHVAIRAARAYLDVCFFHPFPDGNARAARLALDHVLTSEGLALHAAEPVFVLSRSANEHHGVYFLAAAIDQLIGRAR